MLDNFKELTEELTEHELVKIVPMVFNGLRTKIGKEKAIRNSEMRAGLKTFGIEITEPRLRKIIQYIRLSGMIERLIATSKGYWISTNLKELEDYQATNLQRIEQLKISYNQMQFQINRFKNK